MDELPKGLRFAWSSDRGGIAYEYSSYSVAHGDSSMDIVIDGDGDVRFDQERGISYLPFEVLDFIHAESRKRRGA